VIEGERLTDNQRKDFLERGNKLYKNAEDGFMRTYSQYENIAARRGLPLEDSLIDYRYKSSSPAAQQAYPGAPPVGTVVGGYTYKGGDPSQPTSWGAQ